MKFATLVFSAFTFSGCVMAFSPSELPLSSLAAIDGERCSVTVVKASQSIGGAIPFVYVTLDGANVARLNRGQYTEFWVVPGHHTIGVRWRIGAGAIIAPWGVGDIRESPELSKAVELQCRPGEKYFYGNRLKWFALTDVDRMEFQPLTDLTGEFSLDEKSLVYPGAQ